MDAPKVALLAAAAVAWGQVAAAAGSRESPLFRVRKDGRWGYVDGSGRVVISPRFDAAEPFSEGLAAVRTGSTLGYVDTTGRMVLVPAYEPAGRGVHRRFSGGLAAVRSGGRTGFIDRRGALVIPARFDWADDFSEGLAYACDAAGCAYVSRDGKPAVVPELMMGEPFHEGVAVVAAGPSMGTGRVQLQSLAHGRLPGEYEAAGRLSEGRIAVQLEGAWGYVDERGRPAIPLRYAWAGEFAEGVAPARERGGRCGYVDREGKTVIPFRFRACAPFAGGRARVDLAQGTADVERVAFVDHGGNVVFEGANADPPFLRAEDFVDGLAAVGVGGEPQLVGSGSQLGYVDPGGRYVWPPTQ